ncbi:MAG: hypothetical protein WC284_01075 [Candidimonas sp.]|jgi:hypothetical protein
MSIERQNPSGLGMSRDERMDMSARDQDRGDERKRMVQPEDVQRFRKLLDEKDAGPRELLPGPAGDPSFFRGLALGQQGHESVAQQSATSSPRQLGELVDACVHRMLVSDELSGRREVRIDVGEAAFPGLSVRVLEQEGRLVACFVCSSESVRSMMGGMTRDLARHLAGRLNRDVTVQVRSDDDDDPRLLEAVMRPDDN